jgi:hypothetical protein
MRLPVRRRSDLPQRQGDERQSWWWDPFEESERMWNRMG